MSAVSPPRESAHDSASNHSHSHSRSGSISQETLTLRALVSTKDAGVIIGKAGKNVAELRDQTGVKAGVSKVVQGVHERVLTVNGDAESVAKAFRLIIMQLLAAGPTTPNIKNPSTHTSIRLLISHNLMGTIIGRNGLKIKSIQDSSGARMIASKEMLPQSTERVVEVQGSAESIGRAVNEIGKCLLEDWERGQGTVLFHPGVGDDRSSNARRPMNAFSTNARRTNGNAGLSKQDSSPPLPHNTASTGTNGATPSNVRVQNISIPSDMVGCIIGRHGTKITEIRRLSGSKISIAKTPHDETGERMFTIMGTPEANEKALFLLYNQLESEKERRVGKDQQSE